MTTNHSSLEDKEQKEIDSVLSSAYPREHRGTVGMYESKTPRMKCRNLNVFYGESQAIFDVSLDIGKHEVIAMIGPSGCGKSTLIRCLNRMNDTIPTCRVTGTIEMDGEDINKKDVDVVLLLSRVGMVFQKPK